MSIPADHPLATLKAGDAVYKQQAGDVEVQADRRVRFTITTADPDRERDIVSAEGVDTTAYERNGVVLFGHDYKSLPIGRCVGIERLPNKIIATAEFATADLNPLADQVYRMVKAGFLNATSIGFRPVEWNFNEERRGVDFKKVELLEFSVVPVPANAQALIAARAAGIDTAVLKGWAEQTLASLGQQEPPAVSPRFGADRIYDEPLLFAETTKAGDTNRTFSPDQDPIRWNRSTSKAFDVDEAPLTALRLEYEWASRFLTTPIKNLYETTYHVGGARLGSFLSALDEMLGRYKTETIRNMTRDDKEVPPVYETLQLNSKLSRTFLVHGTRFVTGPAKMVVKVSPSWCGIAVTMFSAREAEAHVTDFLAATSARARQYKFLKGEAFALSGEFLSRGTTVWDDLFLDPKNMEPVKRAIALVNERGAEMESRGMILAGPPGTGKTLAARAMMNEAKDATYIWVSARDFYRAGAFGGIEMAYDLARENAPAIIVMEDIDAYLDSWAIDLLKSTLDGVLQQKGVVTVLTTNFPESLPKALIDRPGRFHDVLLFGLPALETRQAMLVAWAEDAPADVVSEIAQQTDGFSGAHLRELVRFAETLRSQDSLDLATALRQALEKVKAQRELIDQIQAPRGRSYRSVTSEVKALYKAGTGECDRCGREGAIACGVCNACACELRPWDGDALAARVAQFSRAALLKAASAERPSWPFTRDQAAWKAFTKARDRQAKRAAVDVLSDDEIATLLDDYGFEAEATAVRRTMLTSEAARGVATMVDEKLAAMRLELDAIAKAGRVLSKANEGKLQAARESASAALAQLDDVLAAVKQPDAAEDIVLEDEADVIELALEPAEDDLVEIDAELIGTAIAREMASIVQRETQAAVNALRGRID